MAMDTNQAVYAVARSLEDKPDDAVACKRKPGLMITRAGTHWTACRIRLEQLSDWGVISWNTARPMSMIKTAIPSQVDGFP